MQCGAGQSASAPARLQLLLRAPDRCLHVAGRGGGGGGQEKGAHVFSADGEPWEP